MEPSRMSALIAVVIVAMVLMQMKEPADDYAGARTTANLSAGSSATTSGIAYPASVDRTSVARTASVPETRMVTVSSLAPPNALRSSEREFITHAAARAVFQIEAARLATDRSIDPTLVEVASALGAQGLSIKEELSALAETRGVRLPARMEPEQERLLTQLSANQGREFDRRLISILGNDELVATIRLYERASRWSQEPTLKAWVDKTLPALRAEQATLAAAHAPGARPQAAAQVANLR